MTVALLKTQERFPKTRVGPKVQSVDSISHREVRAGWKAGGLGIELFADRINITK
jgi:hypothetical protein